MDPLSHFLSLLSARGAITGQLEAEGDWCASSPPFSGLRFGALVKGRCFLKVDNARDVIQLADGDCYLLTDGRPYMIGSNLKSDAMPMQQLLDSNVNGITRIGKKRDIRLIGGRFNIDSTQASILLECLPSVIHVKKAPDAKFDLPCVVVGLMEELHSDKVGASAVIESLALVMLIKMIRSYLESSGEEHFVGWLAALSDSKIGRSLREIHSRPLDVWSLDDLAKCAGMSRSAFALRFKKLLGTSPLKYLMSLRIQMAGQALRSGNPSISEVAFSHGYVSEAAFSGAFKRMMGVSPREYRASASIR